MCNVETVSRPYEEHNSHSQHGHSSLGYKGVQQLARKFTPEHNRLLHEGLVVLMLPKPQTLDKLQLCALCSKKRDLLFIQ